MEHKDPQKIPCYNIFICLFILCTFHEYAEIDKGVIDLISTIKILRKVTLF